ncbi:MAG: ChbG/HpnK family deacetylase [bacterium]|nr:ChbG/HpnK family deacetylase [bacterium]
MSSPWNRGILELATKKLITSISVMIKRDHIEISDLINLTDISLGLHLELKNNNPKKEIIHQITLFEKKFKRLPSHLDSHRHLHLNESILTEVATVAKDYNLPVRSLFAEKRNLLKKNKIKTPDDYIDWHPDQKNKLFENLTQSTSTVIELVCHPGYFDKNCDYIYNKNRKKELEILKSQTFKKIINRFKLINYSQI